MGLPVAPEAATVADVDAVVARTAGSPSARRGGAYEIDGMVVKVDDAALQERLGMRNRSPALGGGVEVPAAAGARRALVRVVWSVGRTGVVTPRADLEPVPLAGVTISSATLHNVDEIARLGVREGDAVVHRARGRRDPAGRRGRSSEAAHGRRAAASSVPTRCPRCGTPLVREEGKVALRCPNLACPAQVDAARSTTSRAARASTSAALGEKQARSSTPPAS